MTRFLPCLLILLAAPVALADEPIRVTVVVILASEKHKEVNEKIKAVADEVQKNHPNLTGFKLSKTLSESVAKGKTHTFKLPGDSKMEVSVHASLDLNGCATLTIKPPTLGEITYNCKCGKYFPILTKFQPDKDSEEKMILAIMAKPCNGGK
jgi:hypothetical protein